MLYQLKSYLKFLNNSSNEHGIHSPFVYDLITKCFYDKTHYPQYNTLKAYRKEVLKSSESIEITDFGQGSRVFKSNLRKVSAIAKNAGISSKRQQQLFRLARYFKTENILELGTSLGLATTAMTLGNPSAKVKTVEGCPNTAKVAQSYFDKFQLKNISTHTNTFEQFFTENGCASAKASGGTRTEKYDLVFIDGNHNKERTLDYFEILLKQATNNSVLIFDDIYWSPEMTEAWGEIKSHPKVTLSIDTFYWGLVFFRSEQQKQHFNIRL